MVATHPIRRTGIYGLLREARRLSGTSGACSFGYEFSCSGSATLTPVGKSFPVDDPLLIDL